MHTTPIAAGQTWTENRDTAPRTVVIDDVDMPREDGLGESGFVRTDISLGAPELRNGKMEPPWNHWITVRHLRACFRMTGAAKPGGE